VWRLSRSAAILRSAASQADNPGLPAPQREAVPRFSPELIACYVNDTVKVGRNDLCPCGSGKKFKRCHLGKDYSALGDDSSRGTLLERNLILIDAVTEILGLKRREWSDVKRDLSSEQVREVFRVVAYLWPPTTSLPALLPEPDGKLRGLFVGIERPESILENVLRYSLYTDEIIVVSPFTNPHCIVEQHNPIVHPERYKAQLLKLASMLLQLAPWIAAGIVIMMPDPGDFDYPLRKATWAAAKARWKEHPYPQTLQEDLREYGDLAKQDFLRTLARMPREYLKSQFKKWNAEMDRRLDDVRIERAIDFLLAQAHDDPLALEQPFTKEGEFAIWSSGANLELGLYIAQMTGAYMYTNMKTRWTEILSVSGDSAGEGPMWSPLTQAFQRLEFKFLDGVPLRFALELRRSGRLATLRNLLRKVWTEVSETANANRAETLARDFGDELRQRVSEAESEWEKIDADLMKWASTTAVGGLSAAGVVPGNLSAKLGGTTLALVTELLYSRLKKRRFAHSVPLSVLLELKRRK
jgi:hypothetical protein